MKSMFFADLDLGDSSFIRCLVIKSRDQFFYLLSCYKLCGRPPQYAPAPASWPLTIWPWKWCPSHAWRGLPVPILVFLGLSVLDLGPMHATDRRQTCIIV